MLLLQIFSLLLVRVPNPTGEFMALQEIPDRYLKQFLLSRNHSVIIFENDPYNLNFMSYGIFRFRNNISFARTNYTNAQNYSICQSEPCILGFHKNVPLNIGFPEYSQSGFALWCKNVLNPSVYHVNYTKKLRDLFKNPFSDDVQYIGVDVDERPSTIPVNKTFYTVTSKFLEENNIIGVTKGVYYYRFFDRQLVPYNGKTDAPSMFINLNNLDTEKGKKAFLAGFVINPDYLPNKEIEALEKIFKKHTSKCNFFIGSETTAREVISLGNMKKAKAPYFVVLESKNFSAGRYLIVNESRYDAEVLDKYLTNIEKGSESFSHISALLPDQSNLTFKEINSDIYHDVINDKANDVLLAITAPWCHHCKQFKPVLNVTSKLFNESNVNVKIFWIDGTANELPSDFPHYAGYPTLFLFRATNKTSIEFDGERTVPSLIKFLHENGSVNFTDPTYDLANINAEIEQLRQHQ